MLESIEIGGNMNCRVLHTQMGDVMDALERAEPEDFPKLKNILAYMGSALGMMTVAEYEVEAGRPELAQELARRVKETLERMHALIQASNRRDAELN